MNLNEIWRDIPDYPDYQVSNLGRVRSLKYGNEYFLKPGVDKDGYLVVSLFKYGKAKQYKIHRLVAQAFIPNPNNYPQVNHKDEVKTNNLVDNLEWCTAQYNVDYSNSKLVGQYDLSGNLIQTWKSTIEIQRQLGFLQGDISNCCTGRYKTAYGYVWKYL